LRRLKVGIYRVRIDVVAFAVCVFSAAELFAQVPSCTETAAMAKMAHARTSAEIAAERKMAGDTYRGQVVFVARSFELRPRDKAAALALLNLIPQSEEQHLAWMTMGDSLCDSESVADMMSLGRLGEHLSRDLAKAVLLVPAKMPDYVRYGPTSVQDPHSDYAVQMEAVCRAEHPEFVKAVEGLPLDKKEWFVSHVFNPDGCHAVALPEAE
jgi:hypothetical protein